MDISGWQFTRRTLGEGVYSFRLNPGAQLLTFAVPAGPRFEARFDARMHEPFAGWCPGLLLVERWNDSELCLDVHRAVELARGERDSAIGRLFDSIVASLRLGPPSDDASARCAPLIDATYYYSILTGGNTYLLRRSDPPTFVSFHVPAGVTISSVSEGSLDGLQTSSTLDLREATSGSRLVIDLATGNEHERELLPVPPPYDLDVGAAFDQIAASFRLDWPLPDLGCAVTSLLIRGQTIGGGTYRVRVNPDYADGLLALAFDVPEGLTVRIDWEEDEHPMIRLTDAETGAWLCLRLGLVEECRRCHAARSMLGSRGTLSTFGRCSTKFPNRCGRGGRDGERRDHREAIFRQHCEPITGRGRRVNAEPRHPLRTARHLRSTRGP